MKFRCTCGLQRITPAQAGKRTCTNTRFRFQEDHPRVGGEKSWWGDEVTPKQGSPPRGRGKVHRQGREGRSRRITPAWAGKSDSRQFSNAPRRDHPRMGGEKPVAMHSLTTKAGSPPRGRGKGWPPPPLGLSPRITPAWAGKRRERSSCRTNRRDHPRVGGEKVYRPTADPNNRGSPPRRRGKEEG